MLKIAHRDQAAVRRRSWIGVAVVVMLAAACSADGSSQPPPPVERAAQQVLRVAVGDDEFLGGSPPVANLGLLVDGLNPGIFETLTVVTQNFGLRPGLALRWEARSPTQWRFELRPGVSFHDGTPLTAAAVVESLQRVTGGTEDAGGEQVALRATHPRGLEADSATAVEELVVEIVLSQPNLRLAEQFANPRTAVLAPGTEAGDGSTPARTPTGTGPFRFATYRPGVDLEVRANPNYWDGAPELESMLFRFGAERDASRLLATGAIDAVGYIDAGLLANVSGTADRQVLSAPARSAFLLLNRGGVQEWSTLQEDPVREAVVMGLDREAVVEAAWPGQTEPSDTVIPAVVLGAVAEQVRPPAVDVTAAKALMNDAGWVPGPDGIRVRDGSRLELDVLVRRPADGLPAAEQAIRKQLTSLGIGARTTSPDGASTPLQRVNAATFDLFVDLRPQDDANPCALCRFFTIGPGGDLTVSGVVGAGAAADALYERVHAAQSLDTVRRLATDLLEVAIKDEAVVLPLASLPNPWLLSSQVQGFESAAIGGAQAWQDVFLSR